MKKNFLRWNLLGVTLAALSMTVLPACSDDDIDVTAEVVIPSDAHLSSGLEAYGYEVPFEIKSNAKWKIVFDDGGSAIAYALPRSGEGNATVKLCVTDNMEEMPRTGRMTIVFPDDTSKNQIIDLRQNSSQASEDNYDPGQIGLKKYGIGYGFNIYKGLSPRGVKGMLLKVARLQEDGMVQDDGAAGLTEVSAVYTGTTVKELTSDFEATAKFEGSGWGIEAEANATFNMNDYQKSEYEYAMVYYDLRQDHLTLIEQDESVLREQDPDADEKDPYAFLTKSAGKALNAPKDDPTYPSTNPGFKKLLDTYGTHLIVGANLGARLICSMRINTSQVKKDYSLDAYARLAYDGVVTVEGTAKEEFKSSFEENRKSITTYIKAFGGNKQKTLALSGLVGDEFASAFKEWKEDIGDNVTYLGFDYAEMADLDNNLMPIYKLVEDDVRREELKTYMETQYVQDLKDASKQVEMGVQGRIVDPQSLFKDGASLVKDITVGDGDSQLTIARVASEFIPTLDSKNRVMVVYPVVAGVTKWNMGYFPGNASEGPHRIVNADGKMKITPTVGDKGVPTELFIRGTSVSATDLNDGLEVMDAEVSDYGAMLIRDKAYDYYPVVKIEDKVWMRENFAALRSDKNDTDYLGYMCGMMGDDCYYYPYGAVKEARSTFIPDGWNLPKATDINTMVSLLKDNNIIPGQGFSEGGVLGLDMVPMGYLKETSGGNYTQEDSGKAYLLLDDPTNMSQGGSAAWKYGTAAVVNPESGVVVSSRLLGPLEGLRIPVRFYRKIE